MTGIENALQALGREAEFDEMKARLISKYRGTALGTQLEDFYGGSLPTVSAPDG